MREKARRRMPTTPGEILREEFLTPLGMTQRRLADHLGYDVKVVNRIVNGRTSVTAEMALKLGAAFRTTPEFWLNAQKPWTSTERPAVWQVCRHPCFERVDQFCPELSR